ncbi:MAG TPA: dienelactone hydrolase family protein [Pyrinomonadaceae bacterium]|jgi:carboxymethylenebutenolidase
MCIEKDCAPENQGRRDFLFGAVSTVAAIAAFGIDDAAQELPENPPTRVLDDPGIWHAKVAFKRGDKEIDGYLARPKSDAKKYRAVLIVAGNRITEEYIPNTCAALAVAGYVALAPNIWHTVPDSARTPDEIAKALEGRGEDEYLQDIRAGSEYLKTLPSVKSDRTGILGFCSGGRRAMLYAARYPKDINAVVPFHPGPKIKAGEVGGLKAPVQIHQGTADRHVPVADIKELEKILKDQNTPVEVYFYEQADHGFLAYTRPYYKPEAALLAWQRTTKFLDEHLKK